MQTTEFHRWLAELQPAMRRWVPAHRRRDADDVIQDANCIALSAWRANPEMTWPNQTAFSCWLRKTVLCAVGMDDRKYWALKRIRAVSLDASAVDNAGSEDCESDLTSEHPADAVMTCQIDARVTATMLDVWELVIVDGLTHLQAAAKLHVRRDVVTTAVRQLRAFIADNTV